MVRNMIPDPRPMRFSLRTKRTPEEEAQKVSEAKAAMVERKEKKEKETAECLELTHQLFLNCVMPRMKALEPVIGDIVSSDLSLKRCVASCRCSTKQGILTVQLILEPQADGTLTLTVEAMHQDNNPISKRIGFPVAGTHAITRWIEDQLEECVKIRGSLNR